MRQRVVNGLLVLLLVVVVALACWLIVYLDLGVPQL
jgi:hypothetical protein